MKQIYRAKPYIPDYTKDSILDKYREILDTGGLIQGKYVAKFEEEVKDRNSPNSLEIPIILSSSLRLMLTCSD